MKNTEADYINHGAKYQRATPEKSRAAAENLTLFELSNMTGRPIAYLKGLLMHPQPAPIQTAKATQ